MEETVILLPEDTDTKDVAPLIVDTKSDKGMYQASASFIYVNEEGELTNEVHELHWGKPSKDSKLVQWAGEVLVNAVNTYQQKVDEYSKGVECYLTISAVHIVEVKKKEGIELIAIDGEEIKTSLKQKSYKDIPF